MTALRSLAAFLADVARAAIIAAAEHVGRAQEPVVYPYDAAYNACVREMAEDRADLYEDADFESWECEVRWVQ